MAGLRPTVGRDLRHWLAWVFFVRGKFMIVWRSLLYTPLIVLLVWAAVVDARSRRIPNWISFTLVLSGLARGIAHLQGATFSAALEGFGVGLIPVVLFLLGGMGAGDVKLSAGIGAWIGPAPMLCVLAGACIVSMIASIAMSVAQGRLLNVMRQSAVMSMQLFVARDPRVLSEVRSDVCTERSKRQIPFAVSLVIATFALVAFATVRWP
jgi:prepilin peptidase CpaA